jgi:YVTN family beta-propeller protein
LAGGRGRGGRRDAVHPRPGRRQARRWSGDGIVHDDDAAIVEPTGSGAAHPSANRPGRARGGQLADGATGSLERRSRREGTVLRGLTAADTSTDQIVELDSTGGRIVGQLPSARHDTAAAAIGRYAYVFGGGDGISQLDQIVRVDPANGSSSVVGSLPAASSDSSAAAIGGTAYVVGGYTGTQWLNTIVAWRPGTSARVVARLPQAVRYAAVAVAGGRLVVAGGSLEDGSASSAVFEYTPGRRAPVRIGSLGAATTHATAAGIGTTVYVIGGRGANPGTATDRIVSVSVDSRKITAAGVLHSPLSDLAAVALGGRVLIAGGSGGQGTVATIGELRPTSVAATRGVAAAANVDVYRHDGPNMLNAVTEKAKPLVYVPNSQSNTVDVIDPRTYRIVEHFSVGYLPQHVVPAWNLRTLYVTNDAGNSLTPIDPRTGRPGPRIPVDDPYNMYFTPDGRHAIVVAERLHRLDFRNPRSFALQRSLTVPCVGIDHMDFSADGSYLVASCEFSGQLVKVDLSTDTVAAVVTLPEGAIGMPQDVKLSADGRIFYVADNRVGGVWILNGGTMHVLGFVHTGAGAHGLYPSRDGKSLYVTNRVAGSISVIRFATRKVVATWRIPGGGSPDMGGVTANGRVLWVSGRYNDVVYAISTQTGKLLAKIPVGQGPHGLCVWPQPGRYSLGHTGDMR